MATLRTIRDTGYRITIYCTTISPERCGNSWEPSLDQLIQYFGTDFDLAESRGVFLSRLVCEKCGQRNIQTIWQPPKRPGEAFSEGTGSAWRHTPPDKAAMARMHAESEMVQARLAAHLEEVAFYRKKRRADAKARKATESGRDFIGPPNPFAPGRPVMKG